MIGDTCLGIAHRRQLGTIKDSMVASLALDLRVLAFLATSPLVRDVFRDFPQEKPR